MSSFELLINEHELLGEQVRRIERLLDPRRPSVAKALAERATLAAMLASHLEREDAEIYPDLMTCRDPATAQIARQFQVDFGRLVEAWASYLATWDSTAALQDWPRFCAQTRAIFAQFAARIRHENELLYPVALGASVISLRSR